VSTLAGLGHEVIAVDEDEDMVASQGGTAPFFGPVFLLLLAKG
jgi:hypothetical protein